MDTNPIIIQVPIQLKTDLLGLLLRNKPKFAFNIDYFLYVVGKIIQIPQYNSKLKNLNKIPLYSKILRYELGKNYRKYLDYMIDNNLIETDNHYIVSSPLINGKCKCYGLSPKYRNAPLVDHEITRKTLLKQIIKWKLKTFGNVSNDELLIKLYGMLDGFSIDMDGATKYLSDSLHANEISQKQYDIELHKCEKINNKSNPNLGLFISKDSYNRVHTNFTNISKNIREKFLFHKGHKVKGIDIVSSQASLLCSLFRDYADKMTNSIKNPLELQRDDFRYDLRDKYVNKNNNYNGDPIHNDINSEFSLFGLSHIDTTELMLHKEIKKFTSIMSIGGIYEFFQEKYDDLFSVTKTRSEVKKRWIAYVFGAYQDGINIKSEEKYMIHSIWKHEFPTLTKLLNHFKLYDYKTLAHKLQRIEADLIFNKVCPEIDSRLGIEYCTVHDSLIVEEQYCEDVALIFNEILEKNHIMTYVKFDDE